MQTFSHRSILVLGLLMITGCSARSFAVPPELPQVVTSTRTVVDGMTPIKHVVVVVQEARTLENLFMDWPHSYTTNVGQDQLLVPIRLHEMTYAQDRSMCEIYACMIVAEGEFMNDFELNRFSTLGSSRFPKTDHDDGTYPYAYMNHAEIAPYRTIASQYVLADQMFPSAYGGDFGAHQDLIAGSTFIKPNRFIGDEPDHWPWGCDAPAGTTVSVTKPGPVPKGSIRPCFTQYPTMADTLDAAGVSWKYYVASLHSGDPSGQLWNAFDAIAKVRYGPDWKKNIISPPSQVLTDAQRGKLPAVSWVIPELAWSDHPASTSDMGPSWVAAIVNAIGEGPDWKSTAIVIVWSEWGGFYEWKRPPGYTDDFGDGPGFRVPCLIVSPYARKNHVTHTYYQSGSILNFMEQVFDLPPLSSVGYGYRFDDQGVGTNSIYDSFDFRQGPRKFVPIPAKYPMSVFLGS